MVLLLVGFDGRLENLIKLIIVPMGIGGLEVPKFLEVLLDLVEPRNVLTLVTSFQGLEELEGFVLCWFGLDCV